MPGLWPDESFQSGDVKTIYPANAAEAARVLERAYEQYCAGELSYEEYSYQKSACHNATHNEVGTVQKMMDDLDRVRK